MTWDPMTIFAGLIPTAAWLCSFVLAQPQAWRMRWVQQGAGASCSLLLSNIALMAMIPPRLPPLCCGTCKVTEQVLQAFLSKFAPLLCKVVTKSAYLLSKQCLYIFGYVVLCATIPLTVFHIAAKGSGVLEMWTVTVLFRDTDWMSHIFSFFLVKYFCYSKSFLGHFELNDMRYGPTASIFYGIWIKQIGAMVFLSNLDEVSLKKLFSTMNI